MKMRSFHSFTYSSFCSGLSQAYSLFQTRVTHSNYCRGLPTGLLIESKLIQLQIIESHRDFNTIYSVKINYRGPNVGICSKPFQSAAAMNEILINLFQTRVTVLPHIRHNNYYKKTEQFYPAFIEKGLTGLAAESIYLFVIHEGKFL